MVNHQTDVQVQHNETSSQTAESLSLQEHQCMAFFFQTGEEVIPSFSWAVQVHFTLNLVDYYLL